MTFPKGNAYKFAYQAHDGQFRRDGKTPYICHPAGVARIVQTFAECTDKHIAVAWLHDTLEDTATSVVDLLAEFPQDVVEAVCCLTNDGKDYGTYIANIVENHLARLVKLADIMHNLSDSPTPKQCEKYAKVLRVLL